MGQNDSNQNGELRVCYISGQEVGRMYEDKTLSDWERSTAREAKSYEYQQGYYAGFIAGQATFQDRLTEVMALSVRPIYVQVQYEQLTDELKDKLKEVAPWKQVKLKLDSEDNSRHHLLWYGKNTTITTI